MNTPITYYGGKQKMASLIVSLIPPHLLYCEPFVGGGAVFFHKAPSAAECINDYSGHVANFYQVAKSDFPALRMLITCTPHSRGMHRQSEYILKHPEAYSELRRAWAFWTQVTMGFSSMMFGGYAFDKKNTSVRKSNNKKAKFGSWIQKRLHMVDLECNDALKVIRSRDSENTFFYIDPPYFNSDCGHYKGYTEQNFRDLLALLKTIKGKFLLSSYPSQALQDFSDGWYQHSIQKKIAVTKHTDKMKTEVLTANYNFLELL